MCLAVLVPGVVLVDLLLDYATGGLVDRLRILVFCGLWVVVF